MATVRELAHTSGSAETASSVINVNVNRIETEWAGIMKSSPLEVQRARRKPEWEKVSPLPASCHDGSVDRDAPGRLGSVGVDSTADENGTDPASGHGGDWRVGRSNECGRN